MAKKTRKDTSSNSLVSRVILKEIKSCRPLRLFITKQKKKGNESNPLKIRSKFSKLATEEKAKYFQKAVDKYIQVLDDQDITEHIQIEGQLFENVLSKVERKAYFESINAPAKPPQTVVAYYTHINKQEDDKNQKPWKLLNADEKKSYIKMLHDVKAEYSAQVKNFAENLPERLQAEYLSFANQSNTTSLANGSGDDENTNPEPISQRRKSVQSIPESFKSTTNDNPQKLTRTQPDALHKCKPNELYYEHKIPDDEKPTFPNASAKNTYIRSIYNQLSEKKQHKFILKSTKNWEEYLELNPDITQNQIPTLHLLLGKNNDIFYYFTSLGLPQRPPSSALYLYSQEREQTGSQQNWADLSPMTKDEYIKRLSKLKNEYHQKFIDFVEKILPSDYIRLEFFRNIKYAAKDYELSRKDRVHEKDDGQLKITQYLTKKKIDNNDMNEFDRIKQQLLNTQLTNEQKTLVQRLGQLMNQFLEETAASKKDSSNSKSSTGATTSNKDRPTNLNLPKHQSSNSPDVILINGEMSSDNAEHSEQNANKKKKKRKRETNEVEEASTVTTTSNKIKEKEKANLLSSSSSKKRK